MSFRVSCFLISIPDFWQTLCAPRYHSCESSFLTKSTAAHPAILLYIIVNICSFYFLYSGSASSDNRQIRQIPATTTFSYGTFGSKSAYPCTVTIFLPHCHQLTDRLALRRELCLVLGHDVALCHLAVVQVTGIFCDVPARLRDGFQGIGK